MVKTMLSISDMALRLGVSRQAIHNAIKSGEIKASFVCHLWRVTEEDFKEYIDSKRNVKKEPEHDGEGNKGTI